MVGIIIANNKYHPNMAHVQKHAPVATRNFAELAICPIPANQKLADAKLKPMVAATKMRKKMRLVRREQRRKTRESMARDMG